MNAKRIVAQGDRMIDEALAEIKFKTESLNRITFNSELAKLHRCAPNKTKQNKEVGTC